MNDSKPWGDDTAISYDTAIPNGDSSGLKKNEKKFYTVSAKKYIFADCNLTVVKWSKNRQIIKNKKNINENREARK